MRVALVVTGRLEWLGPGCALRRLFPQHRFEAWPAPAHLDAHGGPLDGFTSAPLGAESRPRAARELVRAALQAVTPRRAGVPHDFALILDDLELDNREQPDAVVGVVRRAVADVLGEIRASGGDDRATRAAQRLRAQVSFHLAVPMIEAWFFCDPAALQGCGVDAERAAAAVAAVAAPEDFEVRDEAYGAADLRLCAALGALAPDKQKKHRPKWWDVERRARHPKGSLQWLTLAPELASCTSYDEARAGAGALSRLDWSRVFAPSQAPLPFLEAMVADLADALGATPAADGIRGLAPSARMWPRCDRRDLALRNL